MRLTAKPAPKGKSDVIIFDTDIPGFGLRIREAGSRTLVFQYKLGAKHRRIALGRVGAVDFGQVRKEAERLYGKVKLGQDPAGDKATSEAKAARTFEAIAEDYLAYKKDTVRLRTFVEIERHIRKHAKPLHRLHVDRIDRADIATCIATVRKNSGNVAGNRTRASLSALYSWLLGEGLVGSNPVIGTNKSEERARERALALAELRAIWSSLPDDHFGAIMKLLALTGQRAGEIAGLRWSEIKGNIIALSSDRTKNHRDHTVPLSSAAASINFRGTAAPDR